MDILHLSYFLEVAKQRSFTKAALALHISQPSLSKSIRLLESEWGQQLFRRQGRTIELTDAAYQILPHVEALVNQFNQLEAQIYASQTLQRGTLSIGIPPMIGSSFLSPVIRDFIKRYPQIQLKVEEAGSTHIMEGLTENRLQVGFVAIPTAMPLSADMEMYFFHKEPLQMILSTSTPLGIQSHKEQTSIPLTVLGTEPVVFFTPAFSLHHLILSQLQQHGVHPHIVAQSDNWDFIAEMVRNHLGVALLPTSICQRLDRKDFYVRPVSEPIYWTLAMIWRDNESTSLATRLWVSYFKHNIPPLQE